MSQFIEMFGNPTNETVGKLGNELFSFASGKANIKSNLDPSFQYNCYGGNGITGKSKEYLLKDKTIVIGRVGEYCGCVHQTSDYCWVTDNAIYLKTYSDIYRFKFIYYMFVMMDFHRYASETGQPKITQAPLLSCTYPIPTLEAQDIFISIAEQADKSKFGDFKSQFIEMFGDPMTNTKAWVEFGYIGNYTQIVLGTTPNSKNSSYWNGEIKWITPAEMTEESYYIYDTERHLTEEGLKAANLTLLPCRSVLFSTRAPIGKVGLVGSPMYCNQGFKNFVCGDQLNPVYLYYSLIFKREYLVSLGTGTTFKELSKKAVENLKIAVPPLILQNKFEEIYQQADKSKSVIQKALVYLNDIQSDELGKIA